MDERESKRLHMGDIIYLKSMFHSDMTRRKVN
jgi:hypothetical protein